MWQLFPIYFKRKWDRVWSILLSLYTLSIKDKTQISHTVNKISTLPTLQNSLELFEEEIYILNDEYGERFYGITGIFEFEGKNENEWSFKDYYN